MQILLEYIMLSRVELGQEGQKGVFLSRTEGQLGQKGHMCSICPSLIIDRVHMCPARNGVKTPLSKKRPVLNVPCFIQ